MSLLSAAEIKAQLMRDDVIPQYQPEDFTAKRNDYLELGRAVERMTTTTGWGVLRTWLLHRLDITEILKLKGESRNQQLIKAEAFTEILQQVENWIKLGRMAQEQIDGESKEE
jgi:hypothetical protein